MKAWLIDNAGELLLAAVGVFIMVALIVGGCSGSPEAEPPAERTVDHEVRRHGPSMGMTFSGKPGVALGGPGPGPVLGFDGKLTFGFGF